MVWKTFRQYQKNSLPTAGKPGREVETSSTKLPHQDVEKRRRLRRQPKRAHFGSLLILAVTAGAFLLVTWITTKGFFFLSQESTIR